jgi:uncharacterized protein YbjT (DUF2867 family)
MKVLITGANGYIGTRLLPVLLDKGHEVICLVRDPKRFKENHNISDKIKIITGDLLKEGTIEAIPPDIDAAYYLVHTMADNYSFLQLEALSAYNFVQALDRTNCKQIIFLKSIVNDDNQTEYSLSRQHVETVLQEAKADLTVLRTSIIIGPGSAAFEIIRDLAEKLPVITVPRWIKTRSQPISICDVLAYLEGVLLNDKTFNQTFDIGGPDVISLRDMLCTYAKVRKLNKKIIVLPFLSAKTSTYWLYLASYASYPLAQGLVNSMKNESVCKDNRIDAIVPHQCLTYQAALTLAFNEIVNFMYKQLII